MPYSYRSGIPIFYEVAGEGPPLIFVHANPFDRRLWIYQLARYAAAYRTVTVDLRGYGNSAKPETPFSLADMTADVVGVCVAEGIERALFLGCSVGSGIALLAALDHPMLVDGLILVGGNSKGGGHVQGRIDGYLSADLPAYLRRHLRDLFAPGFADTPLGAWIVDLFAARAAQLSGACIARIFRARDACDMSGRLGEIAVPTIVVNGEHDASLASGRATAAGIPGARHVVIPATGHACCLEDPAAFEWAIAPLLELREPSEAARR